MNTDLIQHQPDPKDYLGDSVYIRHDGYNFILTAENGVEVLHRIVLEPEVLSAFTRFVQKITTPPECEIHPKLQPAMQEADRRRNEILSMSGWFAKYADKLDALAEKGIQYTIYGGQVDFDYLPHDKIMEVIKAFPGKWNKELNGGSQTAIDYTATFDGKTIRCWAGEPPPSCRIIEEEVEVPATKRKVRRLECAPVGELPTP